MEVGEKEFSAEWCRGRRIFASSWAEHFRFWEKIAPHGSVGGALNIAPSIAAVHPRCMNVGLGSQRAS